MSRSRTRWGRGPAEWLGAAGRVGVLIALAGSTGLALAQAPLAPEPPPPDARARALEQSADEWIDAASGRAAAVIEWVRARSAEATGSADASRERAERWLKEQVAYALSRPPAPTGLRLLGTHAAPARAAGEALAWTPPGAVATLPARVVVLVHGLDETGSIWDDLGPLAQERGLAVARFDYANDQPIARSAEEFVAAMRELRARGVERVDVVAHSMGGLVVREALTRPGLYGGDGSGAKDLPAVERFIATAPPNHGAALAPLQTVSELREHLVRWIDGDPADPRLLLGFLKDGAGEAAEDLKPGSAFLTALNSRPLPRNMAMTIIAGSVAGGAESALEEAIDSSLSRGVLGEASRAELARALREASETVGDGVVPLSSTRLEGVSDYVVVAAQHRLMLRAPDGPGAVSGPVKELAGLGSALPVILERLARPIPKP